MVNPVGGSNAISGNQYTPAQIQAQMDLNAGQEALTKAQDATQGKSPNYEVALEAYESALASYQSAGKLDPALVPGLKSTITQLQNYIPQLKGQVDLDKADAAQKKNDVEGMLQWYTQAAKDDPALAPQLQSTIDQLRGQVDFQKNQWPQIVAALKEAQNLSQPQEGGVAPDPAAAVDTLQGILTRFPDLSKYQDLSIVYAPMAQDQASMAMYPPDQTQGNPSRAIQILQDAVDAHPSILQQDPSIYYRMAQYAWASGNINQAQQLFGEFAPYQAAYEQAYQDTAGPAQFRQELSYSANAVMSNFQTYAANWISDHIGGSSNWWQNNVLSGLSGIMFNTDGMNEINAKYRGGKHPALYHTKIEGSSNAVKQLDEQIESLQQQRSRESDPKKIEDIDGQLQHAMLERGQALEARKQDVRVSEPLTADGKANPHEAWRSSRDGMDIKRDTFTGDAPDIKNDSGETIGKGQGAAEDPSGPGFWGLGATLQQASAHYKSFANFSASNPLVLESGGTGLNDHNISVTGGMNLFNAEARTFNMVYGGGTGAGLGMQAMYGGQARADVFDEQYALNYAGGDTSIGGQNFSVNSNNALATGGAQEQAAVGVQGDAHGGLAVGTHGLHAGANAGAFAGAQASGQVSANVLGQGGFAMAQGWAGVGAKLNGNLAIGPGGVHFDLGIGAALGVGGYVQLSGNVNFLAMGQDFAAIYGTGNHNFVNMLGRAGELGSDALSSTADMVSNVSGSLNTLMGGAQTYFADNAVKNIDAGGVKTLEGIGEGIGELGTDYADTIVAPVLSVADELGGVASEVGSDFAKGEVGKGLKEVFKGGADAVYDAAKDVGKTIGHAITNFFHGW
ncbi:MAG: hypothetical protein V4534_04225 [Myxococcota bacterium]